MEKMKIQRKDYVNDITIGSMKKKTSFLSSFTKDNCSGPDLGEFSSIKKTQSTYSPNKNLSNRKRGFNVKFYKNQLQDSIIRELQNDNSAADFKQKDKASRKQIKIQKSKSFNQQNNFKILFNKYRLGNIKTALLNKLRQNSIYRIPVIYQPFQNDNNQSQQWNGIQIQKIVINLALVYNIIHIILAFLVTTLLITFKEILNNQNFLTIFQILCLATIIVQIVMGFIRVKEVGSRKLTKICQISLHYLRSTFIIDLLCLISILICLISSDRQSDYFLGIYFLKIPDCIHNLQKIETKVLVSFYWQQYWCLMKILLTNFFYAHCIATILVMMSWLDNNQSWMHIKNIENAPWYEQYSWAYYWGTTIMLTVGFGDIAAANYKQAICLVLIQTISCMALAYNINCIGNLLVNIKSNQLQKQKNLKVLKLLCDKNEVGADLNFKLVNHIKQSFNIQKKFNFEEETQLISKLPIYLKQQLYRSTNYKYLNNLAFVRNFTNRTILAIAQKIEMKISHPDQIVIEANNRNFNKLLILKQGEIGLVPCYNYQKYKNIIIDKFTVRQGQSTVLISLDFLQLPIDRNYHVKSTIYSQIYEMQIDKMLPILKNKDVDSQYFYSIKHKHKQQFERYQIIDCKYCKAKHNKFRCPKLHYIPIKLQTISRYLHRIKVAKNQRLTFIRVKNNIKILLQHLSIGQIIKKSLQSIQDNIQLLKQNQDIILSDRSNLRYGPRKLKASIDDIPYFNKETGKKYQQISQNSTKTKIYATTTIQIVQKQMRGILGNNQDFWNIQMDQAKDYRYYFSKYNPTKLLQNVKFKRPNLVKSKSKIFQSSKIKKFPTFTVLNRKNY